MGLEIRAAALKRIGFWDRMRLSAAVMLKTEIKIFDVKCKIRKGVTTVQEAKDQATQTVNWTVQTIMSTKIPPA